MLAFLLELNMKLAIAEGAGQKVRGPGYVVYNQTAPNIPLDSPFETIKYS